LVIGLTSLSPEWVNLNKRFACPNGHRRHLKYIEGTGAVVDQIEGFAGSKVNLKNPITRAAWGGTPKRPVDFLVLPVATWLVPVARIAGGLPFATAFREDSAFKCERCGGVWPVFTGVGQITVMGQAETRRSATPLGDDDYTRDNRQSGIPMTSTIKVSRRWTQKVELRWEESSTKSTVGRVNLSSKYAGSQLERKIEQSLRSALSLSSETEQLLEQSVEVTIPARRRLTVRLHWKQIWQEGTIEVQLPDATQLNLPYRAAVDITFDQDNIEG
jgi:hypothetical protein